MKLTEIVMVNDQHKQPFDQSSILQNTGKQIGTAENIPVWKFSTTDSKQVVYALVVNDTLLSLIVGTPLQLDKPYLIIQQTWTHPSHRGKGYAPALYVALVEKFNLVLISDSKQTPGGRKVWNKIRQMLKVRVFDNETKQFVDGLSDNEIYSNARYRLIAEHEGLFSDAVLNEHGEYVDDTEFERQVPSILRDHTIFTTT